MSRQKKPVSRTREAARKARRQARLALGPVPPSRPIEPKKARKPKHRKKPGQDGEL